MLKEINRKNWNTNKEFKKASIYPPCEISYSDFSYPVLERTVYYGY